MADLGQSDTEIFGTVLVPLYNHVRFIEACLDGVAVAWRPGFEILLLDDSSSDGGFAAACRVLAKYPQLPVTMLRTGENLGHGNAGTILRLARGRFIIQCDSDDIPMPDRFEAIAECFASDPSCRLVTSNAITISDDGLPTGLFETRCADETFDDPVFAAGRSYDTRWLGATAAYHRDVFALFPSIDSDLCPYGLDLLTPLRALILGCHRYIARPLVAYRMHAANTHRTAGAYAKTPAARERYEALRMTVLAQKLRDIEVTVVDCRLEEGALSKEARRVFFETFDVWNRILVRASREPPPAPAKSFLPAVPPITSIRTGETLSLAGASQFAAIVEQWSGFHSPEAWGCWLERIALVGLRLSGRSRKGLALDLHNTPFVEMQRVSIRVGSGPWTKVVLGQNECRQIVVDLYPAQDEAEILPLVIVSHDATTPASSGGDPRDDRLIGVACRALSLI